MVVATLSLRDAVRASHEMEDTDEARAARIGAQPGADPRLLQPGPDLCLDVDLHYVIELLQRIKAIAGDLR